MRTPLLPASALPIRRELGRLAPFDAAPLREACRTGTDHDGQRTLENPSRERHGVRDALHRGDRTDREGPAIHDPGIQLHDAVLVQARSTACTEDARGLP